MQIELKSIFFTKVMSVLNAFATDLQAIFRLVFVMISGKSILDAMSLQFLHNILKI